MARTVSGALFVVMFWVGVARGEGTPDGGVVVAPEEAFFQGGGIVAQHHFSGPASPRSDVWIRNDGHVLLRREPTLLDGLDPGWTDSMMWRESQIDVALVKKIERAGRASGVCKAKSAGGFSVGGAWLIVLDFGDGLRCQYRRRAHLSIEPPIRPLMNAIWNAMGAAENARALHQGHRTTHWDLGAFEHAP